MGKKLTDRELVIKEAIERFLEDNDLELPRKHRGIILKGLLELFATEKSITTTMIHDHLQERFEYNEFNIKALDDVSDPNEALTQVLITADHLRGIRKLKRYTIPVALVLMLVLAILISSYAPPIAPYDHIKPSQEQISLSTAG